jgi:hypothetical protein
MRLGNRRRQSGNSLPKSRDPSAEFHLPNRGLDAARSPDAYR